MRRTVAPPGRRPSHRDFISEPRLRIGSTLTATDLAKAADRYHRPNGWNHVPKGRTVPCDEASLWNDYLVQRRAKRSAIYPTFFDA